MAAALAGLAPGEALAVQGTDPALAVHLGAWARGEGHRVVDGVVVRGDAADRRWAGAERAGDPAPGRVAERARAAWGLAARGALVEAGGPELVTADLDARPVVWAEAAPRLYAQALAGQWDPATALAWAEPAGLEPVVERAVVQVMTYLVENEQAALMVPARFLSRIHPHYREALGLLAFQVADEARHVEVFSRRARLSGGPLGVSAASGRASLQTLLGEPEPAVATFLLSVLGEGTFLSLLSFLEAHAPDPVTARICRLALQDEARHVAFGLAHLEEQVAAEPALRERLAAAVHRRHQALRRTAGLGPEVHDALVVLAAGRWAAEDIGRGWDAVVSLEADMDAGRRRRLARLGFDEAAAAELSALHTKNFM